MDQGKHGVEEMDFKPETGKSCIMIATNVPRKQLINAGKHAFTNVSVQGIRFFKKRLNQ